MAHYLQEGNGLINDGGGKHLLRSLHRQLKASSQIAVHYNSVEAEDWGVTTSGEEMSKLSPYC